jgi:hypothetical protein
MLRFVIAFFAFNLILPAYSDPGIIVYDGIRCSQRDLQCMESLLDRQCINISWQLMGLGVLDKFGQLVGASNGSPYQQGLQIWNQSNCPQRLQKYGFNTSSQPKQTKRPLTHEELTCFNMSDEECAALRRE